jgi:tetratricopeptide (TPR) repeat protein
MPFPSGLGSLIPNKMSFKTLFLALIASISVGLIYAQPDGYWDKERAFTKEIKVSARDRIIVKTEDLPVGTTEFILRVTLLDNNQQMANSLVSVLKSIPDATGVSQGSAGAIFIISKISGDDKCTYALFSKESDALQYKENGKTTQACFVQDEAVSKDAQRLSVDKSACLQANSKGFWFGFESKNWIMNEKIILEIVPWVNIKLSRAWTIDSRKKVLSECKTSDLALKTTNSDDFCVCVLDKIQNKYRFQEFQKLLPAEKAKCFKDYGKTCFVETGASDESNLVLRSQATQLIQNGKYGEAISKITTIISNGKAEVLDYNSIGYAYIMTKQYAKALKYLKEGEVLDGSELLIQMNLAHAYLLENDFKTAKTIYKQYQSQNVSDSLSWTQKVKFDFETFKKSGITSDDFDRVLKLL